jgi:hypothetical protein
LSKLAFVCQQDNDLYNCALRSGLQATCYTDLTAAVTASQPGTGILVLADQYPVAGECIRGNALDAALRQGMRLFVEYPATFPGIHIQESRATKHERIVVASDFFGHSLPQNSILSAHSCWILPMQPESDTSFRLRLASAKVAGYATAVYGLPETAQPVLLEAVDSPLLVAATKLSAIIKGRYAPTKAWRTLWQQLLRWLTQDERLVLAPWQPAVCPTAQATSQVTPIHEATAFKRVTNWFERQVIADAYTGIGALEGFSSAIDYQGRQHLLGTIRADCTAEAALVMAYSWVIHQNPAHRLQAQQLLDRIWFSTDFFHADPEKPTYGLVNWYERAPIFYGDDNARVLLSSLAAGALLKDDKWNERILCCLLANLRTSGKLGFRHRFLRDTSFAPTSDGWKKFFTEELVILSPHYECYLWACFLWAYSLTGYDPFLQYAKSAIRITMQAYPKWEWTNGLSQEIARMLLPLTYLVRIEDTPEHRQWLQQVAQDLLAQMQPSGAIYELMGPRELGRYPSPESNEKYGTNEASIIQENGDPACDLLYTANFAFLGLHEAAAITQDATIIAAEQKLAEFLCRIQVTAPQHQYLDGAWMRSFDDQLWEYWGSSADAGWGAWCAESGWTNSWIGAVIAMRVTKQTLFGTVMAQNMQEHLPQLVKQMMS